MIKSENTSRRDYLKSAAGIGILPFGLQKTKFQKMKTIPLLKAGDEVVEETEVPAKWWNQVLQAEEVLEKFRSKYSSIDSVSTTALQSSETTIAGRKKKKVVVEIDPEKTVDIPVGSDTSNGILPESLDGVRIETTEARNRQPQGCKNVSNFNNLPGGVNIKADNIWEGSTCCRVEYNGEYYMLTAAHLWSCQNGEAYQNGENRKLGPTKKVVSGEDWALIEATSSTISLDNTVRYPDGTRYPVKGIVTQSGIRNYEESGKIMTKLGRETGKSTGRIQHYGQEISSGCINHKKAIEFGNDGASGDSGGITFLLTDNDTVFVAALHQYGTGIKTGFGCSLKEKTDWSGGLPAWYLSNQGVSF